MPSPGCDGWNQPGEAWPLLTGRGAGAGAGWLPATSCRAAGFGRAGRRRGVGGVPLSSASASSSSLARKLSNASWNGSSMCCSWQRRRTLSSRCSSSSVIGIASLRLRFGLGATGPCSSPADGPAGTRSPTGARHRLATFRWQKPAYPCRAEDGRKHPLSATVRIRPGATSDKKVCWRSGNPDRHGRDCRRPPPAGRSCSPPASPAPHATAPVELAQMPAPAVSTRTRTR